MKIRVVNRCFAGLLGVLMVLSFTRCDVARMAREASRFSRCGFRIVAAEHVTLAGVQFEDIKSVNDLNILDVARVMTGLAAPVLPLTLQLDILGNNPNDRDVGLERLEWILYIDDILMTTGILDQPMTIDAKSTRRIFVPVTVDLKKALSGKAGDVMVNFCMNLAGGGKTPTRFKIKLKPTMVISGEKITYPGFITVNTEFTGK
ncbi:MAG: LEA type 2 family protein [Bacteroidota bacterium]